MSIKRSLNKINNVVTGGPKTSKWPARGGGRPPSPPVRFATGWSPCYFSFARMVNFWIKCTERFSKFCWKVKLSLMLFPTTYFLEQAFYQALHILDIHRNHLHVNKTGETPYNFNWPTCNLLWKSLQINTIARLALDGIGTSCLFGNE